MYTYSRVLALLLAAGFLAVCSGCLALNAESVGKDCTFKGVPLKGKVKVVDSFPDFKVKVVDSFPDLKVKTVDSFPDDCGEWKFVDSFPDFKIKFVTSFPDFKIKMVDSFPGLP
tara:strand:+ start:12613 stop:12954 length:342 start_codon:yes stop_codon:yes gene_type:complete